MPKNSVQLKQTVNVTTNTEFIASSIMKKNMFCTFPRISVPQHPPISISQYRLFNALYASFRNINLQLHHSPEKGKQSRECYLSFVGGEVDRRRRREDPSVHASHRHFQSNVTTLLALTRFFLYLRHKRFELQRKPAVSRERILSSGNDHFEREATSFIREILLPVILTFQLLPVHKDTRVLYVIAT